MMAVLLTAVSLEIIQAMSPRRPRLIKRKYKLQLVIMRILKSQD